jgi:hypothetical protein
MNTRSLVLSAFATVIMVGAATADDRINVTPPIYREQARTTAAVHPASELTTTPSLVPPAGAPRPVVAEAGSVADR